MGRRKNLTDEEMSGIMDMLRAELLSQTEIAKIFAVSQVTIGVIAHKHGIVRGKGKHPVNRESKRGEARLLRQNGSSLAEISQITGHPSSTIWLWTKDITPPDITPPPPPERRKNLRKYSDETIRSWGLRIMAGETLGDIASSAGVNPSAIWKNLQRLGIQIRRPSVCPNGHDLTLPRAKFKTGRCRMCANAYHTEWRKNRKEDAEDL